MIALARSIKRHTQKFVDRNGIRLFGGSVIVATFRPFLRAPIRGAKSSPPARAHDRPIDLSCFRAAF
jgi:hypothetical protein